MNAQQPDYRFPDIHTARDFAYIVSDMEPDTAAILARVVASVVTACPEACPIDTLDRLCLATLDRDPPSLAALALRAMMAGLAIVASHDNPPPRAAAMAA